MKKKLPKKAYPKKHDSNNPQNNFLLAIERVENYVTELEPKNFSDIKIATRNISKASIGAYLSVHSVKETLEFIDQIAHSMIDDIAADQLNTSGYRNTLH